VGHREVELVVQPLAPLGEQYLRVYDGGPHRQESQQRDGEPDHHRQVHEHRHDHRDGEEHPGGEQNEEEISLQGMCIFP